MADDRKGDPNEPLGANGGRESRPELDRLPPPAFPPGQMSTRRRVRVPELGGPAANDEGVPDEAFISPDEPIVRTGSRIQSDAFISPDEPFERRDPLATGSDEVSPEEWDEGTVTGIGDDPHLGEEDLALTQYDDPFLAELVLKVGRLADDLRERGESGLRMTPDMNRFEDTLRAYCVGYLAAQRDAGKE